MSIDVDILNLVGHCFMFIFIKVFGSFFIYEYIVCIRPDETAIELRNFRFNIIQVKTHRKLHSDRGAVWLLGLNDSKHNRICVDP